MEPSKKNLSEPSNGGPKQERNELLKSHVSKTKRSYNKTSPSLRDKTPPSQASYNDISTQSEPRVVNTSSPRHTSKACSVSTWASRTGHDLLGLALQAYEGYQLHEPHQAPFAMPASITEPSGCLYHDHILSMHDNVESKQSLDPMARWLAEGHNEQCAILHLQDGRLSIHKGCQCNDALQSLMEIEMETLE